MCSSTSVACPFIPYHQDHNAMKKALFTALGAVALFVTAPSFAQDPPPTGIGYIPGMPVPQTTPAASSEPAQAPAANNQDGKISKVSVAGQAQAPAEQPQVQQPVVSGAPKLDAEYKGVTPSVRDTPENIATCPNPSPTKSSFKPHNPPPLSAWPLRQIALKSAFSTPSSPFPITSENWT